MPTPLSTPTILRILQTQEVIPPTAEPTRRGMRWSTTTGLEHLMWLSKSADGALQLLLNTGDAKFAPLFREYGRFATRIRRQGNLLAVWPSKKDQADLEKLKNEAETALRFIRDRADLCDVMLEQEDLLYRGQWYAELGLFSYPTRLVKTLILAEDLGNQTLIEDARRRIHSGIATAPNGDEVDVLRSSREVAKEYGKILGRPIDVG
ncbi:hypothetical protein [Dactylosporangium matsuzakiense]|uniref:Uncharacterized protein n=1 Tax=Dactylosporangium matsuzakiense TaxID=53360 RepID=A0A9W6KDY8_9ACTN|nr:hypothetical protein [Dactylosporangium matsuzakiense]UWZ45677.1 hypothetical protein Dmats_03925 [Dactylosporangium matsuzakiense]GLL00302.1 hypothetical protein GCM10017581_020420 [Dactylosporangium matsuzakiense]